MNYLHKIKTDKKFRFNVIIAYLLLVMIAGNTGADKKEAVPTASECNQFGGTLFTNGINACTAAGCAVVAPNIWPPISVLECIDTYLQGLGHTCTNSVASANNFLAGDSSKAAAICGSSRKAVATGDSFCGKPFYTCVSIPLNEQCSGGFQSSIANIGNIIPGVKDMDCGARFYVVAFGGGALLLVLILAAF